MKNQSGRSMIEMLGVLAIIGVLSLGGVAAFNAAMNRHTANNLTYDVMLMVESTLSLGPQEQVPFDASTEYNQMSSVLVAGVANVIVNDVDKEICDILISKGGNGVFVLENQADGSPLIDCADDGTDIVFAFRDGYLPEAGVCNPTCEAGHICSNGQCCPTRIPEHACSIEPTGACANVTPAAKRDRAPCGENGDGFCQNGDCIEWDCSGNWIGANCDICDVNSLNCGDAQDIDAENCLCVCENEGYTGYNCSYSCTKATGKGSVVLSKSACEACGDEYIWSKGYCYSCGDSRDISFDTEAEAEACVSACADSGYERIAVGTDCNLPTDEGCPLVTSYEYWMTKSACEECDNTVWSDGECYGCGSSWPISFDTEAEAEACVSACAGSGYERTAEGRYCYRATNTICPLETERIPAMTKSVCEACTNTVWSDDDGACHGCGYSSSISFDTETEAEECENACAGTEYKRIAVGTECYLAETACPNPRPGKISLIMTKSVCEACDNTVWSDDYCYFCSYSGSIPFDTEAEAEACVSACAGSAYKRTAEGNYCYSSSSTTCPSATSYEGMSKSVCEACTADDGVQRFWGNGHCYGCRYSSARVSYSTKAEAEACVAACADSGYPREVDKHGDLYYCSRK